MRKNTSRNTNTNGHNDPHCLKSGEGRAPVSGRIRRVESDCQASGREVRIVHHHETLYRLYREELRRAVEAIGSYLAAHQLPLECALVRLDGQYGTGAVLADLAGLPFVMRGKDYAGLPRAEVQSRLHLPAEGSFARPESELVRTLYDCPDVPVGSAGQRCRVIVATHPTGETKRRVGVERGGMAYSLFLTNLPQQAFTASDVVALYLHRGAFEPTLADEDQDQDPDRWWVVAQGRRKWETEKPITEQINERSVQWSP